MPISAACTVLPTVAAGMATFGELRFYVWCSTHRGGVFRHWHATPIELRQVLGLPPADETRNIERALDRAIDALPKSVTLRPQWSPLKRRGRIFAYEFQLVPQYADIRRLVWRWEGVCAEEDKNSFLKSVELQIQRYRRNVQRVDDPDTWFAKWTAAGTRWAKSSRRRL